MLLAGAQFETPLGVEPILFHGEQGHGAAFGLWHEGFTPQGAEVKVGVLHADHAPPVADGGVLHFQPGVAAAVAKGGADFAFLDFVVAVFGVVATKADGGDAVHGVAVFTAGVHPTAGQVHKGSHFFAVLVVVLFVRAVQSAAADTAFLEFMVVPREAVVIAAVAVGHAEEALITDPGGTDAAVVAFGEGAGHG